jgi:hypothetical protein
MRDGEMHIHIELLKAKALKDVTIAKKVVEEKSHQLMKGILDM